MPERFSTDRASERDRMVDTQIARRGIRDERLLRAMRTVPGERFVDAGLAEFACDDTPLPIDAGQTISQPYMVALMIDAAAVGTTRCSTSAPARGTRRPCSASSPGASTRSNGTTC